MTKSEFKISLMVLGFTQHTFKEPKLHSIFIHLDIIIKIHSSAYIKLHQKLASVCLLGHITHFHIFESCLEYVIGILKND